MTKAKEIITRHKKERTAQANELNQKIFKLTCDYKGGHNEVLEDLKEATRTHGTIISIIHELDNLLDELDN